MLSNQTYLLELNVKKCKINIQQAGQLSLLLRAGRLQSHSTQPKPIINGVANLNTHIKLNIDQGALETQRCSLTLNFKSPQNQNKVVGLVVINIPEIGEEISKSFKISSTPDKNAEIQISIKISSIGGIQQNTKEKENVKISSFVTKNNILQKGELPIQKINTPNKVQEKPTSPPSKYLNEGDKLKLQSKTNSKLQSHPENCQSVIQKLRRQKQFLKELLKNEMAKTRIAYSHLDNIILFLQQAVPMNTIKVADTSMTKDSFYQQLNKAMAQKLDSSEQEFILEPKSIDPSNLPYSNIESKPLSRSRNTISDLNLKSNISGQKSSLIETLNGFKKALQDCNQTKTSLSQMMRKLGSRSADTLDCTKIRMLKSKIDKLCLGLLGKGTSINKDDILNHKIQLSKLIDGLNIVDKQKP